MAGLDSCFPAFDEFCKVRPKKVVDSIVNAINEFDGTIEQILENVDSKLLDSIKDIGGYKVFNEYIRMRTQGLSEINTFLAFYQFYHLYTRDKNSLKSLRDYAEYNLYKCRINKNIKLLNSSNIEITTKETNGKLYIKFPKANLISNGQRDVLTFAIELMKFKAKIKPEHKYILVIDEIFDYLDDANTVAAQYYLSELLNVNSGNIYVLLLTHLNPYNFRCYLIKDKLINPVYMENTVPLASESMKRFIAFREGLNKEGQSDKQRQLYENLSSYHFHYNPNNVDLSPCLLVYGHIKQTWGNSAKFKEALVVEVNKYFKKDNTYDPYSVAIALRIVVEKRVYDDLPSAELRQQYIDTHTTSAKFELAEQAGVLIPDFYMLANVIHNEASHLTFSKRTKVDIDHSLLKEKSIVYSLQNSVIRNLIARIFKYEGKPLTASNLF